MNRIETNERKRWVTPAVTAVKASAEARVGKMSDVTEGNPIITSGPVS